MRKKWKIFSYTLLALVIVLLAGVGWYVYSGYQEVKGLQKSEDESRFGQFEQKPEEKPPEWTGTERVNILIMGGDERGLREGEVARSDTMMVASIDPTTKGIHLFSVLRDTYIEIPGHGSDRANVAITLGGPELAMKAIGDLLGLDIQYYVYADFQGFIKLVDAIGGVDFYVEKDMKYSDAADGHVYDIDLKEGQQHLDGEKALQYVRFRHDKLSDFTRTERQRNFLKAVADKMQSGWNIIKLPQIIGDISPYIETNLSPEDMLKLGNLGLKSHQAGSAQVPPMELISDERVGGAAVLGIRDSDELKEYVQEVLATDSAVAAPSPSASSSASAETGDSSGGSDSE
ncbi:LCP family protein [Cohnella massiliensis]|uniref:LCP family protein n=1 Tax=Cohnella massiliensis TaxID=1816691 RepID=UPI0009BA3145|nr:LCP family protein [Cohnella massiliensis]